MTDAAALVLREAEHQEEQSHQHARGGDDVVDPADAHHRNEEEARAERAEDASRGGQAGKAARDGSRLLAPVEDQPHAIRRDRRERRGGKAGERERREQRGITHVLDRIEHAVDDRLAEQRHRENEQRRHDEQHGDGRGRRVPVGGLPPIT